MPHGITTSTSVDQDRVSVLPSDSPLSGPVSLHITLPAFLVPSLVQEDLSIKFIVQQQVIEIRNAMGDRALSELIDMGIPVGRARAALKRSKGDAMSAAVSNAGPLLDNTVYFKQFK